MLDLSLLYSKNIEEIVIDDNYIIPKEYYDNTDIYDLKDVKVSGKIILKETENEEIPYFNGKIKGIMIIPDSITLEKLDYPFTIEYDDFLDKNDIKNQNLLDILAFLWENIVLEVPLHFTKVRDLSKFHGDGWKLVSEDELIKSNNPFSELLKDIEKE